MQSGRGNGSLYAAIEGDDVVQSDLVGDAAKQARFVLRRVAVWMSRVAVWMRRQQLQARRLPTGQASRALVD